VLEYVLLLSADISTPTIDCGAIRALKYELNDRERKAMKSQRKAALVLAARITLGVALGLVSLSCGARAQSQETTSPASSSTAKPVGTVKALSGNTITLTTDAGSTVNVLVQNSTRLVRIAPGQKDLKDATPIQLSDVQVGDRILARGKASDDGKSVAASSVILMKESDVTAKQERDREDWQKRGVGGLVSKVDAADGTVTLSAPPGTDNKPVTIQISKSTIIRRYSPDSVKFDDAKPSALDQIHPGDQLRARGTRSADGTELAADEVVSGTFRNIAGLVTATDASANTITVMDLATKKPVTLAVTTDSQLRKLPPMVAQRIALRLRGGVPDGAPHPPAPGANPAEAAKTMPGASTGGSRPGGPPDFQQILKRMPPATLADLQKGDAVMVVTTEGTATTQPTAITLLSGVEPILSASPTGNQAAMLLSPWNLGGGGGDAAAGANP
jgi:co-chaperonin GroES (HSP10)